MRINKKVVLVIGVLIFGLLLLLAALFLMEEEEIPEAVRSQLTGEIVAPHIANRPVLAVIVENTPQARPQTGLSEAGIVIEVVAEGGITRYLALYQESMPPEIGPIRSLRPYFVDWVMGFDASVAHVGGSEEALTLAAERGARSLDQFNHPEPYFRTEDRQPPHNMFASTSELRDLQNQLAHSRSQFSEIERKSDNPDPDPRVTSVTIDFSTEEYAVEFRYQPEENNYLRYLAGEIHRDAEDETPITVKNLVVIHLPGEEVEAVGSGDALVFMDGAVHEVSWRKSSYQQRIELVDEEGQPLALNRGSSWFAFLPADRPLEY